MLEETIRAALAMLPAREAPAQLEALLTRAHEELLSDGGTRASKPLPRQIGEAADLLVALYGNKAADRARRIAAVPGSTLFSRLVLADVEARKGD